MQASDLILNLFGKGLGELLVLHARQNDVCLGNIVLEKGRLIIRDQGLLVGFKPAQFAACGQDGVLGMVTATKGQIWESLTFYGLKHCDLPVDLSRTRHGALTAAQNQYGDSLMDFVGSVYRGYQLMLDNHFLPVILLREIQTKDGQSGLAVADLRVVPMDLAVIRKINDVVRKSVERQLSLDVQDVEVISEEFEKLFPAHAVEPKATAKPGRENPAPPAAAAPARTPTPPSPVPPAPIRPAAAQSQPVAAAAPAAAVRPIASVAREVRRAEAAAPKEATVPAPVDGLAPIIRFVKLVTAEIGENRAFEMFEKWAAEFMSAEVRQMLEHSHAGKLTARQFYDAAQSHFRKFGERFEIVEETQEHLVHEIHGCMYRQACLRVGGVNMDKWGTCMQVIPTVRNKSAEVADPNLEWVWNRCDRRAGQPCLYEIRRRNGG